MWNCPAGHDLHPIRYDNKCDCGNMHDHLQAQCDDCGFVKVFHQDEKDAAIADWNAKNPDNTL